jgi:acetyl-CoA carboxylase biotin carboxyl carrier protein
MGLMNKDEILQILKIVSESTLDEVHLESGDLKLVLKKYAKTTVSRGEGDLLREEVTKDPDVTGPAESLPDQRSAKIPSAPVQRDREKEMSPVVAEADGLKPILAPMLGTFYRAPKPDAPPFVEEGRFVTEEDVVCIIEVMKLFNTVKAGVRGRIAKVCAENAQMVEYKQVLFLIEEGSEDEPPGHTA